MLKRLLSLVLALSLLSSACFAEPNDTVPDFKGLNDPRLHLMRHALTLLAC